MIEEIFKEKWKVRIGQTSFRTNIDFVLDKIVVASSGEVRGKADSLDGVHTIYPWGELDWTISSTNHMDVSGFAVHDSTLDIFFGADGGVFCKYNWQGELLWKYTLDVEEGVGDIESLPVLSHLNDDGSIDVVFNAEGYGTIALDGNTGTLLWEYTFPSRKGTFTNAPAADDLNGDGTEDFVVGVKRKTRSGEYSYAGNSIMCLNGKNGTPIWEVPTGSNIHSAPRIIHSGDRTYVMVAESYSNIHIINSDGKPEKYITLGNPEVGGISGLFSSPVPGPDGKLVIGSSWWGDRDGVFTASWEQEDFVITDYGLDLREDEKVFTLTGRVSASAVVADMLKKPRGMEFLIPTENGELLVFDRDGVLLYRLMMPYGSECTPLVADIDGDKRLEILIAGYDGYLHCYETRRKKGQIFVGSLRNGGRNTGQLELKGF